MTFFHALGLAVQFLTCFPVPSRVRFSTEALGWSVVCYPLVGLILGLLVLAVRMLCADAGPAVVSVLLLTSWVAATGGLHLDGLADSADAWVGGRGDRERSLEIMKDPRAGSAAVTAIVLLLLVKFAALVELAAPGHSAASVLLCTPVIGRTVAPILLLTTPYVRSNGLGSPLVENLPRRPASLAAALSLLVTLIAMGPWPLLAAALTVCGLRHGMLRRLGGCTGDTIGATIEIVEAVVLIVSVTGSN